MFPNELYVRIFIHQLIEEWSKMSLVSSNFYNLLHSIKYNREVMAIDDFNGTRFNLTHLEVKELSSLRSIGELKSLTSLRLSECHRITDNDLKHLKELKYLTSLRLSECYRITDNGLKHIRELKYLKSLQLSHCRISDNGLNIIKELRDLECLNLTYCYNLTDECLKHINKLINLKILNLIHCFNITNIGLQHLKDELKISLV